MARRKGSGRSKVTTASNTSDARDVALRALQESVDRVVSLRTAPPITMYTAYREAFERLEVALGYRYRRAGNG
jgi:hypothetical protein